VSRAVDWRAPELGDGHRLDTSAGTLAYHDSGRGRPIVLVHGFLSNANIWRKLVPPLAAGHRVIAVDWPLGSHHVPLRADADLSPPATAALIAEVLERLDLREAVLAGNDSGGAYSQMVAATGNDRLAALVLASSETPDDHWPPRGFGHLRRSARLPGGLTAIVQGLRLPFMWRSPVAYGRLSKRPIEAQTMHSFLDPFFASAEIRRDAVKVIGSVSPAHSRGASERLRAGEFGRPVLLAWGAEDRVFPLRHAEAYAQALPDARLEPIDDAWTYVSEDNPVDLAAVIARFADGLGAGGGRP
jgi:pimeloyl-ACP methyl ester carboxylesterase